MLTAGEDEARTYAQKHPKLEEDLVTALLDLKAEFDQALLEIEKLNYRATWLKHYKSRITLITPTLCRCSV
ncbi:MAG: hypothetical protein M5U34_01625 [Chloroflexi bacterium]|nr:hypothetical protein [Chloroflexota bacterium]